MKKIFKLNTFPVVLSSEINERVLKGYGALSSRVGGFSSCINSFSINTFSYSNPFSTAPILGGSNTETKDMLYKKGFPAIFLNMEADKQAILETTKRKAGIYLITNKINKKHYVGKSSNLNKRFYNYFSEGFLKLNSDTKIYNILSKLGYKNFSLTILEFCEDTSLLSSREQYYIDIFKPLYNTRRLVLKTDTPKVSKNTKNYSMTDLEALASFKKMFKNQIVPDKIISLINLAETNVNGDFYMQVIFNKKNRYFIFLFYELIDNKLKKIYYANSAL
jgi:group I intron endonuclease